MEDTPNHPIIIFNPMLISPLPPPPLFALPFQSSISLAPSSIQSTCAFLTSNAMWSLLLYLRLPASLSCCLFPSPFIASSLGTPVDLSKNMSPGL